MKNLFLEAYEDYLRESAFANAAWSHNGKFDYAQAVVDKIAKGESIWIGNTKENGIEITADKFDMDKIKEMQSHIYDFTYQDFNDAVLPEYRKNISWNKVFKGDFSGYVNGLASKNKGNAFEDEYAQNFMSKYKAELEHALDLDPIILSDPTKQIIQEGRSNTKRPIVLDGKYLKCISSKQDGYNIGSSVTDVTIDTDNMGPLYLSLKYGGTVTFVNAGIKSEFPQTAFNKNDPELFSEKGIKMLNMLGVDPSKFIQVFNSYGSDNDKNIEEVNVKLNSEQQDLLMTFVKSVIGYGYILVHKQKNEIEYHDIRTEDDMMDIIGSSIDSCKVVYPIGSAKRINIIVNLAKMKIVFNIRSKDGGIYPTHIMADYSFIK